MEKYQMAGLGYTVCNNCKDKNNSYACNKCTSSDRRALERKIEESDSSFSDSMLWGAITDSALLGGLIGGDFGGAIVGDFMNGFDLFD